VRILFLTSRLPYPPVRGDRVRTFSFLRAFAERHDVHLVSFVEGADELSRAGPLTSLARVDTVALSRSASMVNMGAALLSPRPYQLHYYRSRAMRTAVARALEADSYDLVYVHLFRMAPFALRPDGRPAHRSSVVDLTDSISTELALSVPRRPPLVRPAYRWEAAKVRRYERFVAERFGEIWVISEADRAAILELAPSANVVVVPNGVDERLFALRRPAAPEPVVLFVGNLTIPHNVDAVDLLASEVMPRVREEVPGAALRVVGHSPSRRIRDLAARFDFDLAGFVPEITDAYRGGAVFAAPLRFAAGVQNKVIEAMAAGIPVVTSPIGNRGIGASEGEGLVVADGPEAFAGAVTALLRDHGRAAAIGERGRSLVRERYRWELAVERAEAVAG
jgi:sugar transferase (PEP-CTERM/EpsH1 system associated)